MTKVPFFRVELGDDELAEVRDTLLSGWLTTGPKVARHRDEKKGAIARNIRTKKSTDKRCFGI